VKQYLVKANLREEGVCRALGEQLSVEPLGVDARHVGELEALDVLERQHALRRQVLVHVGHLRAEGSSG